MPKAPFIGVRSWLMFAMNWLPDSQRPPETLPSPTARSSREAPGYGRPRLPSVPSPCQIGPLLHPPEQVVDV